MNVLLVTLDQFRGDCLSAAGHPVVRTPNLDGLAGEGVRLARHYSQAAPCGPGRACLYTGTYQLNNRVVGNGTPLDFRFDNVARAARRAGLRPDRVRLRRPGHRPEDGDGARRPSAVDLPGVPPRVRGRARPARRAGRLASHGSRSLGYDVPAGGDAALATEPDRPAEHGVSAFLSDAVIAWLQRQDGPWFAHASYWRPHPPYAAAGHWSHRLRPRRHGAGAGPPRRAPCRSAVAWPPQPAPTDEGELAGTAGAVPRHDLRRRRAARTGPRRPAGPRHVGRHPGRRHLRPRRAARRPGDARQGRPLRVELPRPGHRARPAPSRDARGRWSPSSPRTSTCSPRSATPSASTCRPSATACRSPRSWPGERPPWWRDGGALGVRLALGVHLPGSRTPGPGTAASSPSTWRCCATTPPPTSSTATARGAASTSPPTRRGAPRSPTPTSSSRYAQSMLTWRSRHADRTLSDMLLYDGGRRPGPRRRHVTLPELLDLLASMDVGTVGGDRGAERARPRPAVRVRAGPGASRRPRAAGGGAGARHRPSLRARREPRRARGRRRSGPCSATGWRVWSRRTFPPSATSSPPTPSYRSRLSAESTRTLGVQGGAARPRRGRVRSSSSPYAA